MAVKNISTYVNDGGGKGFYDIPSIYPSTSPTPATNKTPGEYTPTAGSGAIGGAVSGAYTPGGNNPVGSGLVNNVPTTPTTPGSDYAANADGTPASSVSPTTETVPGGTVVGGTDDSSIVTGGADAQVPSGGGAGGVGIVAGSYETPTLVSATDKSDYINAMYERQREAKLAALESAYNQSLAALEKQAAAIPQYYYEAGRKTAGLNAREVQAMNERFNASGLNTGASGQAALAQNAVYQGDMADIHQAEANALAEVEADRTSLAIDYQNQIREAILNNETEKAQALYAEMLRIDESIVDTAYKQAGLDLTAKEFKFGVDKYNQDRADAAAQEAQSALEKKAQVLAAYGDFSGFEELGYPESVIAAMQAEWNAENGVYTGSGTYTGGGYAAPDGWTAEDIVAFQIANGLTPDGIWGPQTQNAYANANGGTISTTPTGLSTSTSGVFDTAHATQIYGSIVNGTMDNESLGYVIMGAYESGLISERDMDALLAAAGV